MTEMESKPPVHVLMPVYNAEKFIIASIRSVLNQTYPDVKLLILDDGSTDASMARVKDLLQDHPDLQDKIFVQSVTHGGVANARSELHRWSQETNPDAYYGWLDADDKYTSEKSIEKIMNRMLETKADICVFNFSIQFEDEGQIANAAGLLKEKEKMSLILRNIVSSENKWIHLMDLPNFMDVSSLGWIKFYAPNVELPEAENCPFEDFAYMAVFFKEGIKITALPEEIINYLRRSTSICGNRTDENFSHDIPAQLKKFFDNVEKYTIEHSKLNMARRFFERKVAQYEGSLIKSVEEHTYPGIDKNTLKKFLKEKEKITKQIIKQINLYTGGFSYSELNRQMLLFKPNHNRQSAQLPQISHQPYLAGKSTIPFNQTMVGIAAFSPPFLLTIIASSLIVLFLLLISKLFFKNNDSPAPRSQLRPT
jgi:glycosyltransferase involved in cell wall biosynthesis